VVELSSLYSAKYWAANMVEAKLINDYTIKIENTDFLITEIKATYDRLISNKIGWSQLPGIEKIKLVVYNYLVISGQKNAKITGESVREFYTQIDNQKRAQKEKETESFKHLFDGYLDKVKIIDDIVSLVDTTYSAIETTDQEITRHIEEFRSYLNQKDIKKLNAIRKKLSKKLEG